MDDCAPVFYKNKIKDSVTRLHFNMTISDVQACDNKAALYKCVIVEKIFKNASE